MNKKKNAPRTPDKNISDDQLKDVIGGVAAAIRHVSASDLNQTRRQSTLRFNDNALANKMIMVAFD